jgi:hypothetical protein
VRRRSEEDKMSRYLTMMALLALTIPVSRADVNRNPGQDDGIRGQVVSDCNHRANTRDLKGQDRQNFVDWCVDRRDPFDGNHVNRYPDCSAIAAERGLLDEARRDFINRCLDSDQRIGDD